MQEFITALKETFIMVSIPSLVCVILGIPLGSILFLCSKGGIYENRLLFQPVNIFINVVRSFPYLIFVVVLIPLTRFFLGTAFGVYAASFPICFVATSLYARFVEQSFYEVNKGILDLAKSMGASPIQIIKDFLIVESCQSLVLGLTSTIISIISYSTVMGIVGGGGIGDYAMTHGYYEYDFKIIYQTVFVIIIIVYFIQYIGNYISKKLDKKRGI